mgnify:CR=1 FL=1
MSDNEKYTFIHPTKTGGSALEFYFKKNYSNKIYNNGHSLKCNSSANPIIIIRDPIDRIISMYKYWKNGADERTIEGPRHHARRDDEFKKMVKDIDFEKFINLIERILY